LLYYKLTRETTIAKVLAAAVHICL